MNLGDMLGTTYASATQPVGRFAQPSQSRAPRALTLRDFLEAGSMIPVPVLSDLMSGILAADDARKGEWGSAALNAAGLIPFLPGLGGIIKDIPPMPWDKSGRTSIPVGINPTRSEIAELFKEQDTLRMLQPKNPGPPVYMWPADAALHHEIGNALDLPGGTYEGVLAIR